MDRVCPECAVRFDNDTQFSLCPHERLTLARERPQAPSDAHTLMQAERVAAITDGLRFLQGAHVRLRYARAGEGGRVVQGKVTHVVLDDRGCEVKVDTYPDMLRLGPGHWEDDGLPVMRQVHINGRWPLILPPHRAARPEWPWWEAARLAAMAHHIGPGDVVYDIGSEEGDLPALWAKWGAKVVLVEPNERVWPNIRAVWEANELGPPAGWFVGFAASGYDHIEPLNDPDDLWPKCAYGEVIGDHGFLNLCERPDVARTTIDQLVANNYPVPTAITIDVEGAELEVLRGAATVLAEHRPKVWVSVHPEFMDDMYDQTPAQLMRSMHTAGYEGTFLATDHEEHWMFLPQP